MLKGRSLFHPKDTEYKRWTKLTKATTQVQHSSILLWSERSSLQPCLSDSETNEHFLEKEKSISISNNTLWTIFDINLKIGKIWSKNMCLWLGNKTINRSRPTNDPDIKNSKVFKITINNMLKVLEKKIDKMMEKLEHLKR